MEYFSTLNDVLFFANNYERMVGSRIGILLGAGRSLQTRNDEVRTTVTDILKNDNTTIDFEGTVKYEYGRARNLKWHKTLLAEIKYGKSKNEVNQLQTINGVTVQSSTGTNAANALHFVTNYNTSYIPNTRTVLNFGLSNTITKNNVRNGGAKFTSNLTYIFCTMTYFISYATRVVLESNISRFSNFDVANNITEQNRKGVSAYLNTKILITL
jgi:hypothetical protein